MGLVRCAAIVICLPLGVACGSDSSGPIEPDASGPDGASALSDARPTDELPSDSAAPSDGSSPDRSSPIAPPPDAMAEAAIAPVDGHWSDTDCGQMLGYLCQ
jgi:hypothetical protein